MTTFSCSTGTCLDPDACMAKSECAMEGKPVVTTSGPKAADAPQPKRIDELELEDYRRGVDAVMKDLWRLP